MPRRRPRTLSFRPPKTARLSAASSARPIPDPADQGKLAFTVLTQPAEGTVTDNGDGTFTFDPGTGFQGLAQGETVTQTFTYQAIDPQGAASNIATVNILVSGVNDAPTASDLAFTTSEDGPVLIQALAGDDSDGDDDAQSLTYVIGSLSGKGTLIDNGDGTFSFDPGSDFDSLQPGESEDVAFTYQAKDIHGVLSAPATVIITVTGLNDAPVATDVVAAAKEDADAVIGSYAATDVDDTSLAFAITQQPSEGIVTDNGDGTFSFDPGAGFQELGEGETTQVTFQYTATDPGGATSNAATGTITVTGVNDAPVSSDVTAEATEDGPPIKGAFAASDPDDSALTFADAPQHPTRARSSTTVTAPSPSILARASTRCPKAKRSRSSSPIWPRILPARPRMSASARSPSPASMTIPSPRMS